MINHSRIALDIISARVLVTDNKKIPERVVGKDRENLNWYYLEITCGVSKFISTFNMLISGPEYKQIASKIGRVLPLLHRDEPGVVTTGRKQQAGYVAIEMVHNLQTSSAFTEVLNDAAALGAGNGGFVNAAKMLGTRFRSRAVSGDTEEALKLVGLPPRTSKNLDMLKGAEDIYKYYAQQDDNIKQEAEDEAAVNAADRTDWDVYKNKSPKEIFEIEKQEIYEVKRKELDNKLRQVNMIITGGLFSGMSCALVVPHDKKYDKFGSKVKGDKLIVHVNLPPDEDETEGYRREIPISMSYLKITD